MNEFQRFGTPGIFEIAARWTPDPEPREHLPEESGWSTGDLQITVGGQVLTSRRFGGVEEDHLSWYLSPVIDWFIRQWTWLFHEENYPWLERTGSPAAVATHAALGRNIASSDDVEREEYKTAQAWWRRHALRAADSSALLPDLYFRRLGDDIEVSWGGRQPVYAPEGFALLSSPGYAAFAVSAVAGPLWQFLEWGLDTAPASNGNDSDIVEGLKRRFRQLKQTPLRELELRHLGEKLQKLMEAAKTAAHLEGTSVALKDIPVIASLDMAVFMFGGLNPSLTGRDATRLMQFLATHQAGSDSDELAGLVDSRALDPSLPPFEEGYELAEHVREELGIQRVGEAVNIRRHLHDLGVHVEELPLETDSIRGAAVAGAGFLPAILVNTTSLFNRTEEGRKFTLAHELCHLLFDRSRAKKLSHVSGAWTTTRVEKRANAFAAMFLASRTAVRQTFRGSDLEAIKSQAKALEIGVPALIEHLFNLGLIDESDRARLRSPDAG